MLHKIPSKKHTIIQIEDVESSENIFRYILIAAIVGVAFYIKFLIIYFRIQVGNDWIDE